MKDTNMSFVVKIVVVSLLFIACENVLNSNKPELGESLDPIEEVSLINGAGDATLTVSINRDKDSYFSIGLDNIGSNEIIGNSVLDIVEANYRDFDYEKKGTKFAVATKMPVDVQTVIMTIEDK